MRREIACFPLLFLASCAPAARTPEVLTKPPPSPTRVPAPDSPAVPTIPVAGSPGSAYGSGGFPLAIGTTWVYSYDEYKPDPNRPNGITTANYLFTDTVTATRSQPPFFLAHVQHQERLVKADLGWAESGPRRAAEFWYAIKGGEVYETPQPADLTNILLAFDLPLAPGKQWCPYMGQQAQKMLDCTYAGKVSVGDAQTYATPAGTFPDCYQLSQRFNSGPIFQWFCHGIGIVAEKYDHAGSRFGFQDTLRSYSRGSP